jgi:hypothetical protein
MSGWRAEHLGNVRQAMAGEHDAAVTERWEVQLPIHPTAAGEARRVLRERLRDAMTPDRLEDAAVVVSELVGQAIVTGPPVQELRLTGDVRDGGVRVTVQDDRPLSGIGSEPVSLAPGSVPQRLVSGLTEAYGEVRVNDVTIVWCELPRGEPTSEARAASGNPAL